MPCALGLSLSFPQGEEVDLEANHRDDTEQQEPWA